MRPPAEGPTPLRRELPPTCPVSECDQPTSNIVDPVEGREPAGKYLTASIDGLAQVRRMVGAILESGDSYLFYGFEPLETEDWLEFLARATLMAPLVDDRHIAHSIITGSCFLRVTGWSRYEPTAVAYPTGDGGRC